MSLGYAGVVVIGVSVPGSEDAHRNFRVSELLADVLAYLGGPLAVSVRRANEDAQPRQSLAEMVKEEGEQDEEDGGRGEPFETGRRY